MNLFVQRGIQSIGDFSFSKVCRELTTVEKHSSCIIMGMRARSV